MVNSAPEQTTSGRKLFFGLFIFPLLIAVGMAVLLCSVVLLTREVETPETLMTQIKTGAPSKRWQKAFELSNELNRDPAMMRSEGMMKEIIHVLRDPEEYDAKTRSYMAIALSRFERPDAASALKSLLAQEQDEEVQLYLIWALGQQKAIDAQADIESFLASDSEALKKMAAYVLGALGNAESAVKLKVLLDDRSRDVRWNAALSLARLGSDAGKNVLLKMVDRKTLEGYDELREDKIEEVMVNAVKGLALLGDESARPVLQTLAESDPSLKVRQAAIATLKLKAA